MGAVNTTYTFTATDTITSSKMNNIIDQTTMTSDAILGTTLEVTSGQLKVRSQGITSNELATNAVTTNSIVDLSVTTGKIADLSITSGKIADSSVTAVKLASDSVETAKIKDANITSTKLNGAQTGTAPIFGVRAWVTFDMTRNAAGGTDALLTPRFLIGSGNVTSVTKTATGVATILFATALPNTNYAYAGSGRGTIAGTNAVLIYNTFGGVKSTTQISIDMRDASSNLTNFPEVTVMIVG